jgi:hypothetical protein
MSFRLAFSTDSEPLSLKRVELGHAETMALFGTVVKVGDISFLWDGKALSTLINGRVIFQAKGADLEVMLPLVRRIDFARVGNFDKK